MATSRASSARAAVDHSFEELYRGHRSDVYRAVLRDLGNPHDAEDVTQAAFLDAYRAVLRGSQPQSPRAWLLAIAENVRRRRFRTSERRPREEPLDADFPVTAELPHELAHVLAEALEDLPDEQRRVFLLREFAGLSYDEIAERVESTVASVQMLLFRARRSLRAQLEPPTVSQRRAGLLLPLPPGLTALFSRLEVAALAPRAAGALGATVVTVVGASVVATGSDAARPTPAAKPSAVVSTPHRATKEAPSRALAGVQLPRASASRNARVPSAPADRVARRPLPDTASVDSPSSGGPTTAAGSAPAPSGAAPAGPAAAVPAPVIPALERPRPLPLPEVPKPLELPVPPPSPVVPVVPVVPAVPVVPTVPIDVTGATGAAGAGAPPPPVPAPPPIPLPPA